MGWTTEGQAVVLAGLLHDIGKFWQRTGAPAPDSGEFGVADVGPHGAHARWSAACYEQIVPATWRSGAYAVLTHHRPVSYEARLIAVADHLAASEREDQDRLGDPRTARLLSIFGQVRLEDRPAPPEATFALAPLDLAPQVIYPRADRPPATAGEYGQLWDRFLAEARGLRDLPSFEAFLVALLALLEKYTWCVPSAAYRERPDVSLSDHLRMTAAFAACLWQSQPTAEELDELGRGYRSPRPPAWREPRFALLAGDLSGVQSFLYTIASRGAARTLRGRSLFLQLLSEAAADLVRRSLDLPAPNLLYVGGAKFYLLAPASALDALNGLRRQLDEIFLEIASGDLACVIDAVGLSAADVVDRFAEAWTEVGQKLRQEKSHRFGTIARTEYARLFAPTGAGGAVSAGDRCDVCARLLAPEDSAVVRGGALRCSRCQGRPAPPELPVKICVICRSEVAEGERWEESIVCARCAGFRELGEATARPDVRFLTVSDAQPAASAPEWQQALARFGRLWEFGPRPRPDRPGALIWVINDLDFRAAGAHGFRLSGAVTPLVQHNEAPPAPLDKEEIPPPGSVKSFEWLARDARGAPYLGVLRMDLDGLGRIFGEGLGHSATPSRLAILSRSLRLFFEGRLGRLVREVDREIDRETNGTIGRTHEHLAVLYSGGDDLFVVGPWDRLPILARRIRQDLAAYCADNPSITISAGIAVADPHYPLYQFANDARKALDDLAKEFQRPDGRAKDALCFLGTTLGWEEADPVFDDVERLISLVGEPDRADRATKRAPRALIHGLSQIAEEYRAQQPRATHGHRRAGREPSRLYYGRWLWLAHYRLRRLAERIDDPATRQTVVALTDSLITPARIDTLGLVARWAEYRVREEGNRETG